ncbi:MAG: hypothetical protein WBX38_11710 [Candidatus Sulfotelmatobacter sp.]
MSFASWQNMKAAGLSRQPILTFPALISRTPAFQEPEWFTEKLWEEQTGSRNIASLPRNR